ncbi:unnamed protein product [Adineta ricciae]|uniref:Uncharacterized protein n=1 Tax=Adineta ricciae TaxID=249248 RepID=A0A813RH02_ADIRI|nr:unnamed protein product [Adineta ricciae]
MEITQLFELEEKTQILTTNVRIEQKWKDENLGWNQSEYVGIRGIRLPSHRIWLPDSYIYNSAFDLTSESPTQGVVNGPYVMVYHTGEIVFPVLMKLRTTCKVNIQYFPFDRQVCGLKFASWIYDISSIKYELVATNDQQQSENIRNSGWAILDVKQGLVWRTKNNKTYGELVYGVHIRRRPLYYIFNVIIPCAMLSCLTCMSFWLPTSSGEKVTLGLTCFVAFSVFMLMVAEKVPATSDTVPIIGIYLTIVMSLTSISVIMAVIVANLYQQAAMCTSEKHRAPRWLRKLALKYLPPLLGMRDKVENVLSQKEDSSASHGLSCEPNPLPLATAKNEFDVNYENMIENLLLQQVLLYTRERTNQSQHTHTQRSHSRSTTTTTTSLIVRQQTRHSNNQDNEQLVLTSSRHDNQVDDESTICVVEPNPETPSTLIESILYHYNQCKDQYTHFDQNLLNLLIKRNREKQTSSQSTNPTFQYRLQWLAIGLIIDRLFFYLYFTATLVSYFVTLWLIPFSHPDLTIDIQSL